MGIKSTGIREKKVPMYGSSHGSFALLSVKSRKQRGVPWFLKGSMPSWQLQADWADMCPKGMCSPTSSCGRITRDLRSCYNIFLYSFLLFIYMLKKHWLEELHPWCHMNKWIVVQKMVGKKWWFYCWATARYWCLDDSGNVSDRITRPVASQH